MKQFLMPIFCLFAMINLYSQETDLETLMDQDWANLKKYSADNEQKKSEPSGNAVVFMGNSITEGWVNASPEFFSDNNYIGRGISGQTTPQMLIRFMPDVLDLHPKAVVILAGTNDIAGNTGFSSVKMITDNIKAMAQLAVANNIKVILCSVLPVFDYPWRTGLEPVDKIEEINQWLKEYALENGHIYLDYFSEMADEKKGLKKEFSIDGVHPNLKGYSVMAPLAKMAIQKALNQSN
ncbi:MAG: SGNH/GDSL hydrolase family protein [Flavobacteriaceae bacterium]|nr:SGNH/GDSL hydrolase family protein [Flavobacteriaceae bacterium]